MVLLKSTKTIYAGEEYLSTGYFGEFKPLQRLWLSKILERAKKEIGHSTWNGDFIRKRLRAILVRKH